MITDTGERISTYQMYVGGGGGGVAAAAAVAVKSK